MNLKMEFSTLGDRFQCGKGYKLIKKKLEKAGSECKINFVGTCEGGHRDALNTRT